MAFLRHLRPIVTREIRFESLSRETLREMRHGA